MSEKPESHIEKPGPNEMRDPVMRDEAKRAAVWVAMVAFVCLLVLVIQPILLILAALVFACMLDGGSRLLERVLPIGRGWRLAIVIVAATLFLAWAAYYTGSQLARQAAALTEIVELQIDRIGDWAASMGIAADSGDLKQLGSQALGSLGQVTAAVTSALGAVTSLAMVVVLGIFIAIEPRLYERGLAWMLPMREREYFYGTLDAMAWSLRRLLFGRLVGMVVEGFGTWLLLAWAGVPMAPLLGLLTGLLAFLPNIGAIISGVLMVLVGFSAGVETGLMALAVYVGVQTIDGYLIVPMVARRTVDLAPALVLGAQIVFGALFGILGLALADPIVAMIKVALERQSRRGTDEPENTHQPVG